jgi:cytochrome c551/c552
MAPARKIVLNEDKRHRYRIFPAGDSVRYEHLKVNTTTLIVLVVIVAAVIGIGAYLFIQRRRSEKLRRQFGPEYKRTVDKYGDQGKAEAELAAREKRVRKVEIRVLTAEEQSRFAEAWKRTQAHFVDEPSQAVGEADGLVKEVMQTRGYPVGDFEQRAADISVDHPHVVTDYRAARDIATRNNSGKATTEDLRQAMVHYRSLFEELLETGTPNTQGDRLNEH